MEPFSTRRIAESPGKPESARDGSGQNRHPQITLTLPLAALIKYARYLGIMLSVAYAQECPLIATGCSPSYANGVQTSSIFLLVMAKITSPGFAFFDLAYCSSDHRGVLVAALHEEPLGNVENLLDRLLRVLIACHGHLRPCYRDKHTMSGVRIEKGWLQKSPTAVTASLETRLTIDVEPER